MDTDKLSPAAPKRQRRWYQFSLRTLLIGTTILAAASGLLARLKKRTFYLSQ